MNRRKLAFDGFSANTEELPNSLLRHSLCEPCCRAFHTSSSKKNMAAGAGHMNHVGRDSAGELIIQAVYVL